MSHAARCVIIGEGPQRVNFERLAQRLGISDRVEFTGPLAQEEVARRYAQADLVRAGQCCHREHRARDVIPKRSCEAMAMQIPVVATSISGIGELVTDGQTGRLVPRVTRGFWPRCWTSCWMMRLNASVSRVPGAGRCWADFDRAKNIAPWCSCSWTAVLLQRPVSFRCGAEFRRLIAPRSLGLELLPDPRWQPRRRGNAASRATIVGVFSARVTWIVLGNICGIFLARWLGPHDRGLLALVILLPATSLTFVKLGISQANVYFINASRDPDSQGGFECGGAGRSPPGCSSAGVVCFCGTSWWQPVLKGVPLLGRSGWR